MIDEKELNYHPRQKHECLEENDTERKINKIIKYSNDGHVLSTYIFEASHEKFDKNIEKQNISCGKETISIVITQKTNTQKKKQQKLTEKETTHRSRKPRNETCPITTGEYLKIMAKNCSTPDVHKALIKDTNRKQKKKTSRSDTYINKSTPFNTKFIVNTVNLQPHTIQPYCQDLLKHPLMQAQMRIYRCQLGSQEEKYCQSCDSDAFFEVLKGLYDCYIKKNCENCNCILCSSFHKAKRKLLLGEASRSKVSVGVETVATKRKAKDTSKRTKDYGLFTSLIAKPAEQNETKITARSKEPLSVQLEKLRKAQASGILPMTLEGYTSIQREKTSNALVQSGSPLIGKKKAPDNKVINQVRKELGLPLESKPMLEDERDAKVKAPGHIAPFEKKTQNETIFRAVAEKRVIVSPEPRPTLELKRKPLETRVQTDKKRKSRGAGLLTPNETPEQKEMAIPSTEPHGIYLAEQKAILERKLIDKIRKELCMTTPITKTALERITKPILSRGRLLGPSLVTTQNKRKLRDKAPKNMKNGKGDLRICSFLTSLSNRKTESKTASPCRITFETVKAAETAGLFSKLQGKTQSEKEKVIQSLANQEIPFPEAKTPSEKKIAKKIRAQLGLPPVPSTKCTQTTKYEKVKALSLITYAGGNISAQMKKYEGSTEAPEQNTPSTKEIRRRVKSASVIPALKGKTLEQRALLLRKMKTSGVKLPEERIPSEKSPKPRMTISKSKGLVITPERKKQYDKTKMLRRLAKSGLPLPEGRTASDKELIKKIRAEMVLPLESIAPSIKEKWSDARATCNRVTTPYGNKMSKPAHNNTTNKISETRIQLVQCSSPNQNSNSVKSVRRFRSMQTGTGHVRKPKSMVIQSDAANKEEHVEKDNAGGTCEMGCGCDMKKIRFKHSYVKIRVTSPDTSSFCSCPRDCCGISNRSFPYNEDIKVTVETATGLPSYSYKVPPATPLKQTMLQYPVAQHSGESFDDLFYSQSHISLEISSVNSDYTTDYSSSTSIVYIYNSESDVSISDIKRMLRQSINSGEFDESIQDYRQRDKPVSYIYQSRFAISRAGVQHNCTPTAPSLCPVSDSSSGSFYTIETVSSSGVTDSNYIRDTLSMISNLAKTLGLSTDSFLVQRCVNEDYSDTEYSESFVKNTDLVPVDTLLRNSHYFINSSQESNEQHTFEEDVAIYRQTLPPFRSKSLKLQPFGGRTRHAKKEVVSSTRLPESSSIFVMVSTSGIDQHYSDQYLEAISKSESSHNIISKARAWMDTKKIKLNRLDIFNKKRSYFKKNKHKCGNEKKNSNACSKAAPKNAMKSQTSVDRMKYQRPSRALSMDTARDRQRYCATDEGSKSELYQSKPNVISEIIKPMIAREEVAQGLVKEAYMQMDYNQTPSSTFYPSDSFGTTHGYVIPSKSSGGSMKPTENSQRGYNSLYNQHLNDNVDSTDLNNPVQYSAEQDMLTPNSEISLASTIYSRGCVNPALYTAQRRQTKKCSDDCKSQKSVKKSKSCVCTNGLVPGLSASKVKVPTCTAKKRCINKTAESGLTKKRHSCASVDSQYSKILNARDSVTCTKNKGHHGKKSNLRKGGHSVKNVKSSYVQKNDSNESAESARINKSFSQDSAQYRCTSRGSPADSTGSRYAKQHSSRYSTKSGYGKYSSDESPESRYAKKSYSHDSSHHRYKKKDSPYGIVISRSPKKCTHYDSMEYGKMKKQSYYDGSGLRHRRKNSPLGSIESRYMQKSSPCDSNESRYSRKPSPNASIKSGPRKCCSRHDTEPRSGRKNSLNDDLKIKYKRKYYAREARNSSSNDSFNCRATKRSLSQDSLSYNYAKKRSPCESLTSASAKKSCSHDGAEFRKPRKYSDDNVKSSCTKKDCAKHHPASYDEDKHSYYDSVGPTHHEKFCKRDSAYANKRPVYASVQHSYGETCCTRGSTHAKKRSYDDVKHSYDEKCYTRGEAACRHEKRHSPYHNTPSYDEKFHTKRFSPNNSVKSDDSKKCCSHKDEHSRCIKQHSITKNNSPYNSTAHHGHEYHSPDCNLKSSHARRPSQSSIKSSAGKCHPCDNPQHNNVHSNYPQKYYPNDSVKPGKAQSCSHEYVAPCHQRKCSHDDNVEPCYPKKCHHHDKIEPGSPGRNSRRASVEPYHAKTEPCYLKKCSHHDAGKPCCQKTCSHQESKRPCCQKQHSHHDTEEHKPPKTCSHHHDVEKPCCHKTCSHHDNKKAAFQNKGSCQEMRPPCCQRQHSYHYTQQPKPSRTCSHQDIRPPCCQNESSHEDIKKSSRKRKCSHHEFGQPCCKQVCSHQDVGKTCCQKKCSHHDTDKQSQNKCSHHDMGQTCRRKECSHEDIGKPCCQKKCSYHDNVQPTKKKKKPDHRNSVECCQHKKPVSKVSDECCHKKKPARSVSADSCFPKKCTEREELESSTTKKCRRRDIENTTESCDSKTEDPCVPKSCLQTKSSNERRNSKEALEVCPCPKNYPKSSKPRKSVFQRFMASIGGTSSKENVSTTCPKQQTPQSQCSSQNKTRRDSMSGRDSVTSHKDSMTSTHYINECGKIIRECDQTERTSSLCKRPVCPGSNPQADKSLSPIKITYEVTIENKEPEKTEKIPEKTEKIPEKTEKIPEKTEKIPEIKEEVKEKKVKKLKEPKPPKPKKEQKYECECPLTNIIGKLNADDEVIDEIDTCCTTKRHEPLPSCKRDTTDKSCLTKEQNAMLHVLKRVSEYLKTTGSIGECHCKTKIANDTETCRRKDPCVTKKCYPHSPLPKEKEREEYESEKRRTSAEPRRRPTLTREREEVDACRRPSCIIRKCNHPEDTDDRRKPNPDDKNKHLCGRRHTDCKNYLKSRKTKNENEVVTKVTDLTKKTSPCLCNSALFEKMLNKVMKEACFLSPAACGRPQPQTPSKEPSKSDKEPIKPVKESPNPVQEPSADPPSTQESSHPTDKTSPAFKPEERPLGELEQSPDLVPQKSAPKSGPGTPDVVPNQLQNVVVSHSSVHQSQQMPFLVPKRSSYHFAHETSIPVGTDPMLVSELKPAHSQYIPNPAPEPTVVQITQQNLNVRTEPTAGRVNQQNLSAPLESTADRVIHQNLNFHIEPSAGHFAQRKDNVALETGPVYISQLTNIPRAAQRLTNTAQQTRVAHVYQHFPNNLSYHHFGAFSRHPNRSHVPSDDAHAHYGNFSRCEQSENTSRSNVDASPSEHRFRTNLNNCTTCKCEQSKQKQETFNYTISCSGCEPVVAYNNSASFRPDALNNIQPDNTNGTVSCSACNPNITNTNALCLDNICSWNNMQSGNNGRTSSFLRGPSQNSPNAPNDTPNYSKRCSCISDNSGQTNMYSAGVGQDPPPNVPNITSRNPPHVAYAPNVSKNNENVCACKPPPSDFKRHTSATGYARSAPSEPSNNLNSICTCKFLQPDEQVKGCESCLRKAVKNINNFDPNEDTAKLCSFNNATPGYTNVPERQNTSNSQRQQSPCGLRRSPLGGQKQYSLTVPGQQSVCLAPKINKNIVKACKCDPPITTDQNNNSSPSVKNFPREPSVRKNCGNSCTACKCDRLESNARIRGNVYPENCLTEKPRHCSPCNPNDKSTGTPHHPKRSQITKQLPRTASGTVICVDRKLCDRLLANPCVCGIDGCNCYLPDYPIRRDPVSSRCFQRNQQGQTCGAKAPIGRCLQTEPKQCPLNPLCAQPQKPGPEGAYFQRPQRPAFSPDGQWNDGHPYQMMGPNGQMVGPEGQNLIPHQLKEGGHLMPHHQTHGGNLIPYRQQIGGNIIPYPQMQGGQPMVGPHGTLNRGHEAEEHNYPTMAHPGQVEDPIYPAMAPQGQMEDPNYPAMVQGQMEDPNYPAMPPQGQMEDFNHPTTGTQGQVENSNNETWGTQIQEQPNYNVVGAQEQNSDMQQEMAGLQENPEVSQVPDAHLYEGRQNVMIGTNKGTAQTPTQQQQMVNQFYQTDPAFKGQMKIPYDNMLNSQGQLIRLHQQMVSPRQISQNCPVHQKPLNNALQRQTPAPQQYIVRGTGGQEIQNLKVPSRSGNLNRTNESYNLMAGAQEQQLRQQVMHPQGQIVQNLTKTKNDIGKEAKKIRKSINDDDDVDLENLLQERVDRVRRQSKDDNPVQKTEPECTCPTKVSCFNQKVWKNVSVPCPCGPDPGPLVVVERPEKKKCSDVLLQIKSFFKKRKNEDRKSKSEKERKSKSKNKEKEEEKEEEQKETKENEDTIDKEATGPTVQIIYGPQGRMLGGYPDQMAGGYAEHVSERYFDPMERIYPDQMTGGYHNQMELGYPDQMEGGYPDQMGESYRDQIEGDYRSQTGSGYTDLMHGAYSDQIEHHGQTTGRFYSIDPLDAIIYGPEGKMIGSSLGTMTQVSQDQLRSRYNLLLDTQEQTGSPQWPSRNGSQGQVMYHTRERIGNYPEGQSSYYRWLASQGQIDCKRSHSGGRIMSRGCVSRGYDEDMGRKSQAQSRCSSYERRACSRHQLPFYPCDEAAGCTSHRYDDYSWNNISGSCSCRRTDDAKMPCQSPHYYQYLAGPMAAGPQTRYTKSPREHVLVGNHRLSDRYGKNRGSSQEQLDGNTYQAGQQVSYADNIYDIHPTMSETRNANPEGLETPPPRTSPGKPMGPRTLSPRGSKPQPIVPRASSVGGSPDPPIGPRASRPEYSPGPPMGPRASSPGGSLGPMGPRASRPGYSPGSPMGPRATLGGSPGPPMGPRASRPGYSPGLPMGPRASSPGGSPGPMGSRASRPGYSPGSPMGPRATLGGSPGQPMGPRTPSPRGSRMQPMATGTPSPRGSKIQPIAPGTPSPQAEKTAKRQTSDESSDQLGGAMDVYQINKKQHESEALKSLLMKAAKQGGCSKEMCCSWHDLQKACLRELRAMKSDLAQSTSGFQISQPKRPLVFCTSESSLSDSSEYASDYNPECTRVKPRQHRETLKDKFKGGFFKKKGKDKKSDKDTAEPVAEADGIPEMEQLIVVEDDTFRGLKFFMEGKGGESPGLSGIFCFNMTQDL